MSIKRLLFRLLGPAAIAAALVKLPAAEPTAAPPADVPPPPLTRVAEAMARWPDLNRTDQTVALEGVVMTAMPRGSFRLHDGQFGIYVKDAAGLPRVSPGDRVRVEGLLRPGGFAPAVVPRTITPLGRGSFPAAAAPVSYNDLASGAWDSQWVEIEGVVRGFALSTPAGFAVLDVGMIGGRLDVVIPHEAGEAWSDLTDAAVRIRGVAAVNTNRQKHILEPSFRVPARDQIEILRSGSDDPFAGPLVPLDRILGVEPGRQRLPHRVRTMATVTRQLSPGTVFVRAEGLGLKVETADALALKAGDRIEMAGYPAVRHGAAVIEQARIRHLGHGIAPAPLAPPSLDDLLTGQHQSDLVRLPARLVDWVRAGEDVTLVFESGGTLFKGMLRLAPATPLVLPQVDSRVEVTGLAVTGELEDLWYFRPRNFALLVAEPGDVRLIRAAPWWTATRLGLALTIIGGGLAAAVAWVWILRREIARKRRLLEVQARHAAALETRSRIARDLHDTLEQGLTGLSLQLKAVENDAARARPHRSIQHGLATARQMLRESRTLARDAIRQLRSESDAASESSFETALQRLAERWHRSGAAVSVHPDSSLPPLPVPVRTHLLGIATEAVTNAVKHGCATSVRIQTGTTEGVLWLQVLDDGRGFDARSQRELPARGFGLQGMHERATELLGELRIQSEPGRGTRVEVRVPLPAAAGFRPPPPRPTGPTPPPAPQPFAPLS